MDKNCHLIVSFTFSHTFFLGCKFIYKSNEIEEFANMTAESEENTLNAVNYLVGFLRMTCHVTVYKTRCIFFICKCLCW